MKHASVPQGTVEKPINRSALRIEAGRCYYAARRYLLWLRMRKAFARTRSTEPFSHLVFEHRTPLMRKLKDVDMWMQVNKITNLRLAVERVNGILLQPGEVFSYWRLIGKPTSRKGYKKGMILRNGHFEAGVGGGLCQLANLIFWMTIHTPLTVIERHRHSYDVFPDSSRTQPFASGATCSYPHIDLMIRNDTSVPYQLLLRVGEENLEGQWRTTVAPVCRYEIVERNHCMKQAPWGGYTRHNEIYRQMYDLEGNLLEDRLLIKNAAIMMYAPFLESGTDTSTEPNQSAGEDPQHAEP